MLQAYVLWVAEELTMSGDKNFDRETLEYALAELGRRAFAAGRTVVRKQRRPVETKNVV
jgi:hypothetical protein